MTRTSSQDVDYSLECGLTATISGSWDRDPAGTVDGYFDDFED